MTEIPTHQEPMKLPKDQIRNQVALALAEDIGAGDLTASLISESERARATLICREDAVACGRDWINAVFEALDPSARIDWRCRDGEDLKGGEIVTAVEIE